MNALLEILAERLLVQEHVGVIELLVEPILCKGSELSYQSPTPHTRSTKYAPICFTLLLIPLKSPFRAKTTNAAFALRAPSPLS